MKAPKLDADTVSLHEELFETQMSLQSRLLDYIEQANAFGVLDDAWSEFNLYENVPLDPDDPEPALHFFPWALFYWQRDVSEHELEAARDQLLGGDAQGSGGAVEGDDGDDEDDNWLDKLEALSDDEIAKILSEKLEDDDNEEFDDALEGNDDDESHIALPPLAVMFMDAVDRADEPDSQLAEINLSVKDRRFIEAAAHAPYSFYKVVDVGPGAFVTLEDLIVPGQVRAYAEALVDIMEADDVVYGQVVCLDDANLLCSVAPMVLPSLVIDALNEASARIAAMTDEIGEDARHEIEFEMRSLYHSLIEQLEDLGDEGDESNSHRQ